MCQLIVVNILFLSDYKGKKKVPHMHIEEIVLEIRNRGKNWKVGIVMNVN